MKNATPAQKKLGFNIHALTFVPAMAVLLIVNLWTGSPYWVQWVLLGWGIGLLAHWWFVLGPGAGKTATG
jgi:2TM domain-containing protein